MNLSNSDFSPKTLKAIEARDEVAKRVRLLPRLTGLERIELISFENQQCSDSQWQQGGLVGSAICQSRFVKLQNFRERMCESHSLGALDANDWQKCKRIISPKIVASPARSISASFRNAHLTRTNLRNANLSGADLYGADLSGADLSGANLVGVSSGRVKGIPYRLPVGFFLFKGYLVGPGVDLSGASLTDANLTGANLAGVKLFGVISGGIKGVPSQLPTGFVLGNGYLVGPGVNLSGADLSGTDLSGVALTDVRSGGVKGMPLRLPTGALLVNGYLVGPGVNLSGADLSGTDLSGVDLTLANLTEVDLSDVNLAGAKLVGVKSGGIRGLWPHQDKMPVDYCIVNGYVVGPKVNLSGADLGGWAIQFSNLSGSNLSGANLNRTNFFGTNLSGADLRGTNLADAFLEDANLTAVISGGIKGVPVGLPTGVLLVNGYLEGPK